MGVERATLAWAFYDGIAALEFPQDFLSVPKISRYRAKSHAADFPSLTGKPVSPPFGFVQLLLRKFEMACGPGCDSLDGRVGDCRTRGTHRGRVATVRVIRRRYCGGPPLRQPLFFSFSLCEVVSTYRRRGVELKANDHVGVSLAGSLRCAVHDRKHSSATQEKCALSSPTPPR